MEFSANNAYILNGEIHPTRNFVICLGQSEKSKGVMFVMYSVAKEVKSQYVNQRCYLGQLADDLESAIIAARAKINHYEIEIWNEETFKARKVANITDPIVEFGKYKGMPLTELYDKDVDYLYWMAKNGNFKSLYMQNAMAQYLDMSKEVITTRNKQVSNLPITIDTVKVERDLSISSIFEGVDGYGNMSYTVKMADESGNKYFYKGSSKLFDLKIKGNRVVIAGKVSGNFESMGITYNVIKLK